MPTISEITFLHEIFETIPDERKYINPVEYVESVRRLTSDLTSKPGWFDYDYVPYCKEIVNHMSPESPVRKIVFMKPSQIGATTAILESAIAYNIGCAPSSVMYVSADKELVETGMEVKVERMLDTCGLREKIFAQTGAIGNRNTGDTKNRKQYPGGFLHAIGARNPGKLRAMSYQWILLDEVDGFPEKLGNEGSPVSLAEKRSKGFPTKRKILYLSTPTIMQTSHIYNLFMRGDRRYWNIPCPRCGENIIMKWHIKPEETKHGKAAGIIFEIEGPDEILIPESVHYRCQNCGGEILEKEKETFLSEGKWIPTARAQERHYVSYSMESVYAPANNWSWIDIAYEFLKAWNVGKGKVKDLNEYRTFRNQEEGLPFEEQGEALKIEVVLRNRRATYTRNQINNTDAIKETGSPILQLTCAVDVQKSNELIYHVIGWCKDAISYTVEFSSFAANDVKDFNDSCWRKLEDLIENKKWVSNDHKEYSIGLTVIDAAWGESTDTVYQFCRQYGRGVHPTFGRKTLKPYDLTWQAASKAVLERSGCQAFLINTYKLKDRISRVLNANWYTGEKQPMFYMNFPADLHDDFFQQFTAEHKVPKIDPVTKKFLYMDWVQIQGRANHALDTSVYSYAAIEMIADYVCTQELGLKSLSWPHYWQFMQKKHGQKRT